MKICPKCSQTYGDESLNFCLNDGSGLQHMTGAAPTVENITPGSSPYLAQPTGATGRPAAGFAPPATSSGSRSWIWVLAILGVMVLVCGGGLAAFFAFFSNRETPAPNRRAASTPVPSPSKASTPSTSDIDTGDIDVDTDATPKGEYELTMAKYNQISIGTSRADVERILGGSGNEISSSDAGGMRFSVNQWEGDDYKSIILTFKNDKVMSRSQVGLK